MKTLKGLCKDLENEFTKANPKASGSWCAKEALEASAEVREAIFESKKGNWLDFAEFCCRKKVLTHD